MILSTSVGNIKYVIRMSQPHDVSGHFMECLRLQVFHIKALHLLNFLMPRLEAVHEASNIFRHLMESLIYTASVSSS